MHQDLQGWAFFFSEKTFSLLFSIRSVQFLTLSKIDKPQNDTKCLKPTGLFYFRMSGFELIIAQRYNSTFIMQVHVFVKTFKMHFIHLLNKRFSKALELFLKSAQEALARG